MIGISAVITRLGDQVTDLAGRIQGAAEFSAIMKSNALPQVTPAAFVLPLGLQGGKADAATGEFTQSLDRMVGVVLVLRNTDRVGSKAVDPLDALVSGVIDAIAGWDPDNAIGVFRLVRGSIVSMAAGTIVFQLDFALPDQLRIAS